MGARVAILQSNYIPWKGYFDIINDVDLFLFYDDVQFTKNDWRNRNVIKTAHGLKWLSVPVGKRINRLVSQVEIGDASWQERHLRLLWESYRDAPHYRDLEPLLCDIYSRRKWQSLSLMNQFIIKTVAHDVLGVKTEFGNANSYTAGGERQERLIGILQACGASEYVSGPAAKAYIDPTTFADAGIQITWKNYEGYPEYPQAHPPFEHAVTILDLLFHVGRGAADFIWGWRRAAPKSEG